MMYSIPIRKIVIENKTENTNIDENVEKLELSHNAS